MVSFTLPIELLYGMYWIIGSIISLELLLIPLRKKQKWWMAAGLLIPLVQIICIAFLYPYVQAIFYPVFWITGVIVAFMILYIPMRKSKISLAAFSLIIPTILVIIVYLVIEISVPMLI